MKLKADFHDGANPRMVEAVQSSEFRALILEKVLGKHLHVKDYGPAEFYIQACDFAVASDPMCEVRLTGVSVTRDRASNDFVRARNELETIYVDTIQPLLAPGERLQLMVSLMLDRVPFDATSSIVEDKAVWLTGSQRQATQISRGN